jgi:hypothetical protein
VLEAALKQKTELLFAIHSVSVRDRWHINCHYLRVGLGDGLRGDDTDRRPPTKSITFFYSNLLLCTRRPT